MVEMADYDDPDECTNGGYLPAVKMFDIIVRKEDEFIAFINKMDLGEVRKKFHNEDGEPIDDTWEEFLDPENPPEDVLLGQSAWNSLTNEERTISKVSSLKFGENFSRLMRLLKRRRLWTRGRHPKISYEK